MTFPAGRSARLQPRAQRRSRFRRHSGLSAGAATLGALTLILAGCSSGSPSSSSSSSSREASGKDGIGVEKEVFRKKVKSEEAMACP